MENGAYVDPEKLRSFAGSLKGYAGFIEESLSKLKAELSRLGDTWRDQEYEAFRDNFVKTQRLLHKFIEEAKRTQALLQRDADALEDAQRVRLEGGS